MATLISDQTLEEIRSRIDIAELIGSRITLKRAGTSLKACCPFHKEKTPSFVVSPDRGTYHCFGCGAHGDVFKFLMQSDGMTFLDAVRVLAEKAQVPLETHEDRGAGIRRVLYDLHSALAAFYQECLARHPAAAPARTYLGQRKLDTEIITRFGLGYAPAISGLLERWAEKNGYTLEQMTAGGVLLPPRADLPGDKYYDRFQGRLIFPIRDATGRVAGFSGRILDSKASPAKYVNSPETPIFHKGRILYALDQARASIVRSPRREALVCEGQIDVIRCHAHGFNTAVAAQGTAFTEEHVELLKRYADSVLLVFDGDDAGRKAALRTGSLFLAAGLPVRVAVPPAGEDPDSLLRDQGREAFQQILDSAASITIFQIETLQAAEPDARSVDAVGRVSASVLEMLAGCSKAVLRSHLLQEAAASLKLPVSALETDLESLQRKRSQSGVRVPSPAAAASSMPRAAAPVPPAQTDPSLNNRRPAVPVHFTSFSLCNLLLHHADDHDTMNFVSEWLPPQLLEDEPARAIARAAIEMHATGEDRLSDLSQDGSPEARRWIGQMARRESPMLHTREVAPRQAAEDMVARLWIAHLKRERQTLDSGDEQQAERRYALTRLISDLGQIAPWQQRAAQLSAEVSRLMVGGSQEGEVK